MFDRSLAHRLSCTIAIHLPVREEIGASRRTTITVYYRCPGSGCLTLMTVSCCWSVQSTQATSQNKFADSALRIQPITPNDIKKQRNQNYLKKQGQKLLNV